MSPGTCSHVRPPRRTGGAQRAHVSAGRRPSADIPEIDGDRKARLGGELDARPSIFGDVRGRNEFPPPMDFINLSKMCAATAKFNSEQISGIMEPGEREGGEH